MNYMKKTSIAVLMVLVATPLFAQERERDRDRERTEMRARVPGRGFGGGVEAALRNKESLKLTDTQVNQLEALRKEIVAQRQNEAREMIDLQSRIAAGQLERDEVRKQMESRRETMRSTMEQRRERMEKILTAEQREQILRQQLRAERMRGPRGPGPGRGPEGPPIRGRYRWN